MSPTDATQRPTILKKRSIPRQVAFRKRKTPDIKNKNKGKEIRIKFQRAEEFVKRYRMKVREVHSMIRMKKKLKRDHADVSRNIGLVIRVRDATSAPQSINQKLKKLKLNNLFSAVFVRMDKETTETLRELELYVTYGTPDMKTVRDLIFRRGSIEHNGKTVVLNSNSIIEEKFGEFDIICIEDLVHEIFSVGPHWKEAVSFLLPFQLSPPPTPFPKIPKRFIEGGHVGDRKQQINNLVSEMN